MMVGSNRVNLGNLNGFVLVLVASLAGWAGGCKTEESKPAAGPTTAPAVAAAAGTQPVAVVPAPAPRPTSPPPEKFRLGYFANFTHAQAVLGVASGEFASA